MGEAPRDLPIAVYLCQIALRGDEREVKRPALRGLAGLDERHAVAGGVDLVEVVEHLVVRRELGVSARRKPEHRLGGRQPRLTSDRQLEGQRQKWGQAPFRPASHFGYRVFIMANWGLSPFSGQRGRGSGMGAGRQVSAERFCGSKR